MNDGISEFYRNLIKDCKILSIDEEKELFKLLRSDYEFKSNIRDKIFKSNMRLVVKIASRYSKICSDIMTFDDLISYGEIGLLQAIDRFDVNKEYKFSTYATFWIKHEIMQALSFKSHDLHTSYGFYKDMMLYNEKKYEFYGKYERMPSLDELCNITGFNAKKITYIEKNMNSFLSLNSPVSDDGNCTLLDCVYDESVSIEDFFDKKELRNLIMHVLNCMNLSDRNKEIFILRYGLNGYNRMTLIQLSEKYGISHQAVRQVEQRILRIIKLNYINLFEDYINNNSNNLYKNNNQY